VVSDVKDGLTEMKKVIEVYDFVKSYGNVKAVGGNS